ncbi:3-oxoacyl-ACP synthase III family protein [Chitinophaga nivalis]|uniref:Ketoacyl-ACP synthase III n=1 Tax=Chitinophaga nivalis TaxID=2991709 RepID=A0ABT3II75_9BACT|nr:3-oxoacyl-[acyl-carrier-protein] synthase III C-terminal domain-containing protein [Chitinophaga nivalis]MCW3466653.1 ketoacyl-ACP synthase III [Chitinophaga nivalis]MCW3483656.1 ketoacyl-ACP synthase III [Chitinophaga nivalis]
MSTPRSVFTGTGSFIPEEIIDNSYFLQHDFKKPDGSAYPHNNADLVEKFRDTTGIESRRYALSRQRASDLAALAAQEALENSHTDPETLDYIIVAHNFGDIHHGSHYTDILPSLATRVKAALKIHHPECVAYDILFGCPGWIEGLIQANSYIQTGRATRCLIIGAETLSRVADPFDRDQLLYADGAGAVVLEARANTPAGILTHKTRTYALEPANIFCMDTSFDPDTAQQGSLYFKMQGRKVFELVLTHVPALVKDTLDQARLHILDITKILIHQANEKMSLAVLQRIYHLYGIKNIPSHIMPLTTSWLGNSSVATVPTLLDLLLKKQLPQQEILPGDKVMLVSMGAGININAMIYQF